MAEKDTIIGLSKKEWRHALISIAIGGVMAFLSSLFDTLAQMFKSHGTEVISGTVASATYLLQKIKLS